ncbi:hypothetical protein [Nitratireductor indicus]|uniref:hypothetical protein n=1 Tax=Nitratireductor indicus TaxID=721133 RepID=UPI0028769311|nr:hypothetical protein [Nitratireductor indicus]MDS1135167.1 hypothetical protein [Nitratireductor indicus]
MILAHIKRSFRETFPVRASEWALAAMIFNWGIILVFNDDLFASHPSYRVLKDTMAQDCWTVLCLGVGGFRLLVLLINGAWRRSPHLRAAGAFLSILFWFQISMGFALVGTWGTALAVYPVLLLLDSYNAIRAVTDAAVSDEKFKRQPSTDAGTLHH